MIAPVKTLIDELLEEQRRLDTPVARFSTVPGAPALESHYRDLIPLSAPRPGEQYAFEVDLDACSGCKACVSACHSLNGLDEEETWRDIGLLVGGTTVAPYQQTVTTACHHCADPACLNGCPVLAYDKDPVTGVVRHLDDQCIGCQYCVLKCPYDVPKYNERLGIVRKCDLCHGRLSEGEAPACVQACPTEAIRIVTVITSGAKTAFLPTAPAPDYTQPTTRYVTARPMPANVEAADARALRPQPGHTPLVLMLVLTQVSVGLFTTARTAELLALAWLAGAAGLAASVAHLGKPLKAWRIFLGLRKSWLSREAVLFGAWFGVATAVTAAAFFTARGTTFSLLPPLVAAALAPVAGTLGAGAVFCSAMIYIDTRRTFWRAPRTWMRFGGTTLVSALVASLPVAAALALAVKLGAEWRQQRSPDLPGRLLRGPLTSLSELRFLLGGLGIFLLALATHPVGGMGCQVLGAGFFLAGEIAERRLFFRAVDAPKMPGGFVS